MKLIKAAIWYILIMLPFSWVNHLHIEELKHKQQIDQAYNTVIDSAVDDAMIALNQSGMWANEEASGYETRKNISLPLDAAIRVLWDSMAVQLRLIDDTEAVEALKSWIPMMIAIEYDGFRLYHWQEYIDIQSAYHVKHVWEPKQAYSYQDESNRIFWFTLDDYVTVYDPSTQQWVEGYQRDLRWSSSLSLLQDTELFETVRKQKIIEQIQLSAQHYINDYNDKYARNGWNYQFTLPTITDEEWHNSLQDVGLFVFVQGTPFGTSSQNRYAYGAARIVSSEPLYGTILNGVKVAYPAACKSTNIIDIFDSSMEAAREGYYPKKCGN